MNRFLTLAAVGAATLAVAVSVTVAAQAQTPQRGGILRHSTPGGPANMDCANVLQTPFIAQLNPG